MEKILNVFDKKQYTFAIDRSNSKRMEILENGFLNIHEKGTSAGLANAESRSFIEAQYLKMKVKKYEQLPASLKPKSMYLVPTPDAKIDLIPTHYFQDVSTKKYTGDTWILDREQIKDNTLFIVGDSYDRALINGELGGNDLEIAINSTLDNHAISDHLLPLEDLPISAPYYYEQVKTENRWRFNNITPEYIKKKQAPYKVDWEIAESDPLPSKIAAKIDYTDPEFDKTLGKNYPELMEEHYSFYGRPFGNYVEGLYFGQLPQKKITTLIYHERPPTMQEMKKLKELGIKVIDGRGKF